MGLGRTISRNNAHAVSLSDKESFAHLCCPSYICRSRNCHPDDTHAVLKYTTEDLESDVSDGGSLFSCGEIDWGGNDGELAVPKSDHIDPFGVMGIIPCFKDAHAHGDISHVANDVDN